MQDVSHSFFKIYRGRKGLSRSGKEHFRCRPKPSPIEAPSKPIPMNTKIQKKLIIQSSLQFCKLLNYSVKSIKDWSLFIYDYLAASLNDSHTSRERSYQLMRFCYSFSNGKSSNFLSIIPQLIHPPQAFQFYRDFVRSSFS